MDFLEHPAHTFVTTMLDAGADLRNVQIAACRADPAPPCATTEPARTSTTTRTTSSPPTWPRHLTGHVDQQRGSAGPDSCVEFLKGYLDLFVKDGV